MRVLAIAALACLLSAGRAEAREHGHHEHGTDGRSYLKRANSLAGDGKCAAAVKDYTKAYEKLHDPIVLFNRAECYRRLGENAKAVEDYRGYLQGFPKAPNRTDIENKIATLERPPAAPPRGPAVTRAPATPPAATAPTRPSAPTTTAPPGARAPAPPPVAAAPAEPAGPMPFLPPPPGAGDDTNILVDAPKAAPKETSSDQESSGSRWWLWTALAVVAVGGGVAGYVLLRPKDEAPPPTTLGNYRF